MTFFMRTFHLQKIYGGYVPHDLLEILKHNPNAYCMAKQMEIQCRRSCGIDTLWSLSKSIVDMLM